MLRTTLASIHSQEGCELEHIVIDGGSTDGTREFLEEQAVGISSWVSEPDGGAYSAVTKGFSHATGDVMAWLNASDLYTPWTLSTVADIFTKYPEVQWITSLKPVCVDHKGHFVSMPTLAGFTRDGLLANRYGFPTDTRCIQQESTFWRRSLWEALGSRIPEKHLWAGDMALWAAFFRQAPLYGVNVPLAAFRFHAGQRSTSPLYTSDLLGILKEERSVPPVPHQTQYGLLDPKYVSEGRAMVWEKSLHDGCPAVEVVPSESEIAILHAVLAERLQALQKARKSLAETKRKLANKTSSLQIKKEELENLKKLTAFSLSRRLRKLFHRPSEQKLRIEEAPTAQSVVPSLVESTSEDVLPSKGPERCIWVAFHKDAENIGDRACNPLKYLPMPAGLDMDVRTLSLADIKTVSSLTNELIILGGGGSLNFWCRDSVILPLLRGGNTLIAWGIGHHHDHVYNTDSRPWKETLQTMSEDYDLIRHFALAGIRDFRTPWDYVPCPTCLHPAFDVDRPAPIHEAVIYEHAEAGQIPISEFPKRNNHGREDLPDILQFLALGRTVITNSFHGAYWALLMGRAVLIYEPWCSKFYTFRQPLTLATRENWREQLPLASAIPNYLAESRALNHNFGSRVFEEVARHVGQLPAKAA